ncbi:hypothetical protein DUF2589 [Janthinobacterium sp. HH01]|uniref:DUF2589 domain-containing protein n=1 Tax=Janthinobacterium sp. HH01 TaxID=1198452 RepID=UPI0002AEA11B|nr:DUF2589 domain-containing protein [Janthinobacterium sp. HH01]ELX10571.1 hypothetical protein DUF2589 [Janthinobacterium sp. HH01]
MAMMANLENVVRAIAGSIMDAQNLVEKAQVANISSFFDRERRPMVIDLELPAIHSSAAADEFYLYRLPLISLVPHSALIIGEAEIDMDVELGALSEAEPAADHPDALQPDGFNQQATRPSLMVNPETGGLAKKSGNAAHIKLKLVAAEKSEGLARLINDVVKGQGYTPVAAL